MLEWLSCLGSLGGMSVSKQWLIFAHCLREDRQIAIKMSMIEEMFYFSCVIYLHSDLFYIGWK
jgi:hypothetical protein